MRPFDPLADVENATEILVDGAWPNFHDAEIDELLFRTGDIRPEEDIWTGASLSVRLTLWAERFPPVVRLTFRDCEAIRFDVTGPQNDIWDLSFAYEHRGYHLDGGSPLTPFIDVRFLLNEHPTETVLGFRCFGVRAEKIGELPEDHGDRTLPFD